MTPTQSKKEKKPSERIREILDNMDRFLTPEAIAQAIMHYLDEEYEKRNNKK